MTSAREANPFGTIVWRTELSLAPLISLVLAALLILLVRRIFRISRWHGPATHLCAHRTDNELDVRAGFGSTLAPLFRQVAVPRLVNMARWCISGRRWGLSVRRLAGF